MKPLQTVIFFILGFLFIFNGMGIAVPFSINNALSAGNTTVKLSSYNKNFLGWVNIKSEDWAFHGYCSLKECSAVIKRLNSAFHASKVLLIIPRTSYNGKAWGFENFLTESLKEVSNAIQKVIFTSK